MPRGTIRANVKVQGTDKATRDLKSVEKTFGQLGGGAKGLGALLGGLAPPAGIAVDEQIDSRRKLPVTTGVIDLKGFINALVKIGYDGPVECEPFDQELRAMEDDAALQKTIDSLNRLWGLIEV